MWGIAHPLDIAFNARNEREELQDMRRMNKMHLFNETLHELHLALQHASDNSEVQSDSEQATIQKQLLHLFLPQGLHNATSHAVDNAYPTFLLHASNQNPFDSSESLVPMLHRIYATLRTDMPLEDATTPCGMQSIATMQDTFHPSMCLHPEQESIIETVTAYVAASFVVDDDRPPPPPRLAIHAGPGTGKSTLARELHNRLSKVFGSNILRFMAPSGVAACNLHRGSTCHHGVGLSVYGDSAVGDNWKDAGKDKLHRL